MDNLNELIRQSPETGFMHVALPRYHDVRDDWNAVEQLVFNRRKNIAEGKEPIAFDDFIRPLMPNHVGLPHINYRSLGKTPELIIVGAGPSAKTPEALEDLRNAKGIVVAAAAANKNVVRKFGLHADVVLITAAPDIYDEACLTAEDGKSLVKSDTIYLLSTVVSPRVEHAVRNGNGKIVWYESSSIPRIVSNDTLARIGDCHAAGASLGPLVAATHITKITTYGIDLGSITTSDHDEKKLQKNEILLSAGQDTLLTTIDMLPQLAHLRSTFREYGRSLSLTMHGNHASQYLAGRGFKDTVAVRTAGSQATYAYAKMLEQGYNAG